MNGMKPGWKGGRGAPSLHVAVPPRSTLTTAHPLLQRYMICPYHAGLASITIEGVALRFCQQVGCAAGPSMPMLLFWGCLGEERGGDFGGALSIYLSES